MSMSSYQIIQSPNSSKSLKLCQQLNLLHIHLSLLQRPNAMSKTKYQVFIVLLVIKICHGWTCGRAETNSAKQWPNACLCGDTILTYSDLKQCCGPDTCHTTPNGDVHCPDGRVCAGNRKTYPCGDNRLVASASRNCTSFRLPNEKNRKPNKTDCSVTACMCGNEKFTYEDWYFKTMWCCPSDSPDEHCKHQRRDDQFLGERLCS